MTILLKVAAQRKCYLILDGMSPKSFILTLLVPTIIVFLAQGCKLLGTVLGLADDVFWLRERNCNDEI